MNTTTNTPKKCLCGAPVATWKESPIANKAGMCKQCCEIYLNAGVLQKVKTS